MLVEKACKGCTACVKHCPVEAIRVREKKAIIIDDRCIDCGECIRICPNHAKKAVVDSLSVLDKFEYTVALPAPTLYAQFKKLRDRNIVLTALKKIGFDDVFEVATAADAVSAETQRLINSGTLITPIISTACPAVVRIIRVRFPSLLPNLLKLNSPMEAAARWARLLAVEKTGLPPEKIGCIFISPCPAKASVIKHPLGNEKSQVDAVVSISDIYPKLRAAVKTVQEPERLARASDAGLKWAMSGGEGIAAGASDYLAADGVENVIKILEEIENGEITGVRFVELNACVPGCVGGALTVENPFIARARLSLIMNEPDESLLPPLPVPEEVLRWDDEVKFDPVLKLDEDVIDAMQKLIEIQTVEESFSGMDCGVCGAPSCRALAEDIVRGYADESYCIFNMRVGAAKSETSDPEENSDDGT